MCVCGGEGREGHLYNVCIEVTYALPIMVSVGVFIKNVMVVRRFPEIDDRCDAQCAITGVELGALHCVSLSRLLAHADADCQESRGHRKRNEQTAQGYHNAGSVRT